MGLGAFALVKAFAAESLIIPLKSLLDCGNINFLNRF
jgi:hypothetical protein